MEITLDKKTVKVCLDFAKQAWDGKSQSQKHFGGNSRSKNQFMADIIEGKLAEFIFSKFLNNHGIRTSIDLNHYEGETNTDTGDVLIHNQNGSSQLSLDVKGTSHFAQWLLIENYKFYEIGSRKHKSEIFVLIAFNNDFEGNKSFRLNPFVLLNKEVTGTCIGWAKSSDFYDRSNALWFTWEKGTRPYHQATLPATKPYNIQNLNKYLAKSIPSREKQGKPTRISVPLDAKLNYGLPKKWLNKDWGELLELIKEKIN